MASLIFLEVCESYAVLAIVPTVPAVSRSQPEEPARTQTGLRLDQHELINMGEVVFGDWLGTGGSAQRGEAESSDYRYRIVEGNTFGVG